MQRRVVMRRDEFANDCKLRSVGGAKTEIKA